ncbi:phosphoenolpyruvate hydrolase family protein [Natribacillus halophilus]|uniref:DNA-binding transcriptional response regulator, NtrC family, contains REC, AAA-type ATPase, and a Fis-type DNA-binding domains n=1 Tax=Natribacillus halophilus TaxID=549003 RepID=A0A1G8KI51_9BACI|nr:phosphoenolpyruvate hydrolase family protein [Natribacillus halophilus]SDI42550.1 DNA-binding transcriptional response regulator, NtrC family, contains REC, AAA-type ATPase, and a Fis-type DNA-binding domains [Natribacillus halophilus]
MLSKREIREQLSHVIQNNKPVIGVAAGSGLSAKQAYEGGADLFLVLNAGRYRAAGVSSLACLMPYSNSNELVMGFGRQEILPRVKDKPVIFGACATDPTKSQEMLLEEIIQAGFHGVNNFPSVGVIDGIYREALEENEMGFQAEVDLMKKANDKGLFTLAFTFDEEQSIHMAEANVDVICVNLGWTIGGDLSVTQRKSVHESMNLLNRIFDKALEVNPDVFTMVYGGPINDPEQASMIYEQTKTIGYIGGSSLERIPAEASIKETTQEFKNVFKLREENKSLKKELVKKKGFDEIVGHSRSMQEIYDVVNKVADKNINVLVHGKSGTGKELVVRAIHHNSPRYQEAFVKLNCAAIPKDILESELFGHEKGAFTGADQKRVGKFELAHKGTLFLDEVGELDPDIQVKFLRVIQQQEFERVGGNQTIKVDVRIICATNMDLREAVHQGKFREDLYYRLNVISIYIPPLRKRKEDIPSLVNHFLRSINEKFDLNIKRLSAESLDAMVKYDWPGNIRELEHALERAAILCDGNMIGLHDLPESFQITEDPVREDHAPILSQVNNRNVSQMEKQMIQDSLEIYSWNRTQAAQHLGITRRTLYNKIKKFQLEPREE